MSQIREVYESDLQIVFHIERENMQDTVNRLNQEPWSDDKVLGHLRECMSRQALLLYEDDKGIAGHYCYSAMKAPGYVSLDSIQVAVHRRNQGIGSSLLRDFINRTAKKGFNKAALYVHIGNLAFRLYQRHGFIETKRTTSHIRMEKDLIGIE
jgi:ribosomal protein S18 acetylase RimI-like enzyme